MTVVHAVGLDRAAWPEDAMNEDVSVAIAQDEDVEVAVKRLGLVYDPRYHVQLSVEHPHRITLPRPSAQRMALVITGPHRQWTRVMPLGLDVDVHCTSWYSCSKHGGWTVQGENGQPCPTGDGGVMIEHQVCV